VSQKFKKALHFVGDTAEYNSREEGQIDIRVSSNLTSIAKRLLSPCVLTAVALAPIFAIAVACSLCMTASATELARAESTMLKNDNDKVVGQNLRTAIDEEYKRLADNDLLRGPPHGGNKANNISPLVERYIPIGSSIDDAEKILAAAGFSLRPRGRGTAILGDYRVIADISPYKQMGFTTVSLGVALTPPGPNDFSVVTKLTAGFAISMP
jgi:hypothetical protein